MTVRISGSSMYEGYGHNAFPIIAQRAPDNDSAPMAALMMFFFIKLVLGW